MAAVGAASSGWCRVIRIVLHCPERSPREQRRLFQVTLAHEGELVEVNGFVIE